MTFETIDMILDEPLLSVCGESAAPAPRLKQKVQPWLLLAIGLVCLSQGVRLLLSSDPIGILAGFGLLVPVPTCCYLGFRDFLRLREGRNERVTVSAGKLRRAA